MTTITDHDETPGIENLEKMTQNLKKVEELSERLHRVMATRQTHNKALDGPNQELFGRAAQAYWNEALHNPAKVLEHQMSYWSDTVKHFVQAQHTLAQGKLAAPDDSAHGDRRFENPLWSTHPYFNYVKQQYLINSQALSQAVDNMSDLDPAEKNRLTYFSRQIIDMMSPTNFLATNPDALEKAIETEGQSLVQDWKTSFMTLKPTMVNWWSSLRTKTHLSWVAISRRPRAKWSFATK